MSFRQRVYAVVFQIPAGKVASYQQVAALAGKPTAMRACGHILKTCGAPGLPWHRVINAQGRISLGDDPVRPDLQRRLLEGEGVRFRRSGACDWKSHRWVGPDAPLAWEDEDDFPVL